MLAAHLVAEGLVVPLPSRRSKLLFHSSDKAVGMVNPASRYRGFNSATVHQASCEAHPSVETALAEVTAQPVSIKHILLPFHMGI